MNNLKKLEEEVSAWPNISVHPHRFGGREFLFGKAESGMCILAVSLTSRFPGRFVMRSWRKV